MTVLKNKQNTSALEYERNFMGLYDYMKNLIDGFPRRWQKPLGKPMKEDLNEIYDRITKITDMYVEKEGPKVRYKLCEETIRALEDYAKWIYLYWILSEGRNGIKPAPVRKREFMAKMFNREIYLLAGVMRFIDRKKRYGPISVHYMKEFHPDDIKGVVFLEKLSELNSMVYPKSIRIPEAERDEEMTLACRLIRDAFYNAYEGNREQAFDKESYARRRRYLGAAISQLYRLNRPMLKMFMVHMFSNEDMTKITNLINDSLKLLQGLQEADKERYGNL